jgi:hypothetical protein
VSAFYNVLGAPKTDAIHEPISRRLQLHPDSDTLILNIGVTFTMTMQWRMTGTLVYHNQGQHTKAEPLHQRALAIKERALGPEHPDVATCLENYASLLRKMDRPEEAAPLETRAMAIRAKTR